MKKKFTVMATTLALTCLMFIACPTELSLPPAADPWGYPTPFSGPAQCEASGYSGGIVRVFLELEEGEIVDVWFDLDSQTPAFVRRHPTVLPPLIIDSNSFNFAPNVISGSTETTAAIIEAGTRALEALNQPGGGGGACEC